MTTKQTPATTGWEALLTLTSNTVANTNPLQTGKESMFKNGLKPGAADRKEKVWKEKNAPPPKKKKKKASEKTSW